MWQDYGLGVAQVLFIVALVPSILSGDKPAAATSWPTAAGLAFTAFIFATLGLWLALTISALSACLWLTLAIQASARGRNGTDAKAADPAWVRPRGRDPQ